MRAVTIVRVGDAKSYPILISDGKTVIGRGSFLHVTDKRISRNHGVLELSDGNLFLTPTHVNPCFFKKTAYSRVRILEKDVPFLLEDGHMFGLLPNEDFFQVHYHASNKRKLNSKEKKKNSQDLSFIRPGSSNELAVVHPSFAREELDHLHPAMAISGNVDKTTIHCHELEAESPSSAREELDQLHLAMAMAISRKEYKKKIKKQNLDDENPGPSHEQEAGSPSSEGEEELDKLQLAMAMSRMKHRYKIKKQNLDDEKHGHSHELKVESPSSSRQELDQLQLAMAMSRAEFNREDRKRKLEDETHGHGHSNELAAQRHSPHGRPQRTLANSLSEHEEEMVKQQMEDDNLQRALNGSLGQLEGKWHRLGKPDEADGPFLLEQKGQSSVWMTRNSSPRIIEYPATQKAIQTNKRKEGCDDEEDDPPAKRKLLGSGWSFKSGTDIQEQDAFCIEENDTKKVTTEKGDTIHTSVQYPLPFHMTSSTTATIRTPRLPSIDLNHQTLHHKVRGHSPATSSCTTSISTPSQVIPSAIPCNKQLATPVTPTSNNDTTVDNENNDSECTVCFERPVDAVVYTCGHMCMCFQCAHEVKQKGGALCPICRQEIKDVIKIYKS